MISIEYRFCLTFGGEAKPEAKRKQRPTAQVFTIPFRADNFKHHLSFLLLVVPPEYDTLESDEKVEFFTAFINDKSELLACSKTSGQIHLLINSDIVEILIADMRFDVKKEGTSMEVAIHLPCVPRCGAK